MGQCCSTQNHCGTNEQPKTPPKNMVVDRESAMERKVIRKQIEKALQPKQKECDFKKLLQDCAEKDQLEIFLNNVGNKSEQFKMSQGALKVLPTAQLYAKGPSFKLEDTRTQVFKWFGELSEDVQKLAIEELETAMMSKNGANSAGRKHKQSLKNEAKDDIEKLVQEIKILDEN